MKKCANCGAELLDEAAFCSHCGTACEEDMATTLLMEEEATALLEEKDLKQTSAVSSEAEDEATALLDESMLENPSDLEERTTVLEEEKSFISSNKTAKKVGMDEIQKNIEKKGAYRNHLNPEKRSERKAQSTVSSKKSTENNVKKKTMKKIIISIVVAIALIVVMVFAVLLFLYNGVSPTVSYTESEYGNSVGEYLELPISVKDSVSVYNVDKNKLQKTIQASYSDVFDGDFDGKKVFLRVDNLSEEDKPALNCNKITCIWIDETSGEIALGSRANLLNIDSWHITGIDIGMNEASLLKYNGTPYDIYRDSNENVVIYYYRINMYNRIHVILTNGVITEVAYLKAENIFDFM